MPTRVWIYYIFGAIQQTLASGLIRKSGLKSRMTFAWGFGLGGGLRSLSLVYSVVCSDKEYSRASFGVKILKHAEPACLFLRRFHAENNVHTYRITTLCSVLSGTSTRSYRNTLCEHRRWSAWVDYWDQTATWVVRDNESQLGIVVCVKAEMIIRSAVSDLRSTRCFSDVALLSGCCLADYSVVRKRLTRRGIIATEPLA